MRILLLESDGACALPLSMLFRLREHSVEVASSMTEARRMLSEPDRFDCAFCEMVLPDGGACELGALLQEVGIPAVAMSMVPSALEASERAGFIAKLQKP